MHYKRYVYFCKSAGNAGTATFFSHAHTKAFLQTAVLTLVAMMLINLTFSI